MVGFVVSIIGKAPIRGPTKPTELGFVSFVSAISGLFSIIGLGVGGFVSTGSELFAIAERSIIEKSSTWGLTKLTKSRFVVLVGLGSSAFSILGVHVNQRDLLIWSSVAGAG